MQNYVKKDKTRKFCKIKSNLKNCMKVNQNMENYVKLC